MAASTNIGTGLNNKITRYSDWVMGLGVIGLMLTLVTPVPAAVLDGLLAMNIASSLMLLLVSMNVRASAELSTFPTILLFSTLFRLGLNVASTRLILSEGKAGTIISAFGRYVIGDSLVVGLVVFLILIIIQFVVITKGAGRVSEVAARFTLDAMPGKQMAIDADLNAGLIDSDQARDRREAIATEAEFYGAMDGASKFVRGDAVAGLIITGLNLIGGITIGAIQGMPLAEAGSTYSILTIGDGLVSQIPALLVSTASALLVTKSTSKESLAVNMMTQIGGHPKATLISSGILFLLGLLPGMPMIPFTLLATLLLVVWRSSQEAAVVKDQELQAAETAIDEGEVDDGPGAVEEALQLLQVDRVALEIGYRLIPLVQDKSGTGILDHISQLRKRFATQEGVVLPPVRIKDNIRLEPGGYRIMVGGQEIGKGAVQPGDYLAMDGGTANGKLRGKQVTDPAFGLPAWWVPTSKRDEAELLGYTVIDPTSVLVTHLTEILRSNLPEIMTRDDVKALVENAKINSPAVVEELIPDKMSFGEIQQVLANLLRDGVPVRNVPAILECLADNVGRTRDVEALSELVRQRLGRVLCEMHADREGTLHAVTLEPGVESRLASAVGASKDPEAVPVNPAYLQRLVEEIGTAIADASRSGKDTVLLARSNVRRFLSELVRSSLPKVAVLSYNEVVPARSVETSAIIKVED